MRDRMLRLRQLRSVWISAWVWFDKQRSYSVRSHRPLGLPSAAAETLRGKPVNEDTAGVVGIEAVAGAVALSQNEYKIQLASVAVKRALLKAVGHQTGGLDFPSDREPSELQPQETHLA